MAIFLTGSTGYIGSYIAHGLLTGYDDRLALLVRAKTKEDAEKRLWKSLQLHMDFEEFRQLIADRVDIFLGDLTHKDLGLDATEKTKLIHSMDSVIHCAASLNRKSAKACFNVNLRGTLQMCKLARAAQDHHGLRRFSDISTVAVCGLRKDELVEEADAVQWDRSDYDPYARTKKYCEYMVHELLPDVESTVFRPSIVLGDSRFAQTTQFDMVRAFCLLARLPLVPFRSVWRADIVPADYVSRAVVTIHQKEKPLYDIYNLSSGSASMSYRQIIDTLVKSGLRRPYFAPWLESPFNWIINLLCNTPRRWGISLPAALMKVFLPYLVFNTVFDNSRVVEELGEEPATFDNYAYGLLRFAQEGNFQYPYKAWPEEVKAIQVA
jgi:thioester reductase-like protein